MYDVHDYEVTYILNPTMSDEDVTAMNERISGLITAGGIRALGRVGDRR